jgi:hypothetical protein
MKRTGQRISGAVIAEWITIQTGALKTKRLTINLWQIQMIMKVPQKKTTEGRAMWAGLESLIMGLEVENRVIENW